MAKVIITYVSAEGDKIQAIASGSITYPECLDLQATAVGAFCESLAFALNIDAAEIADALEATRDDGE